MGILKRLYKLWIGFASLFVSGLEQSNPEIAYENAVNSMTTKYVALKQATAAVIRRRDDLRSKLENAKEQLLLAGRDLEAALEQGQDDAAVVLIQRKESLEASIVDFEKDLSASEKDSEEAKESLNQLKAEIMRLKDERDRMLAKLKSAEARLAIQQQLEGISVDAELKALEGVRENINNKISEVRLNDELKENDVDTKLSKIRNQSSRISAEKKLEELKLARGKTLPPATKKTLYVDADFEEVKSPAKAQQKLIKQGT